MNAEMMTLWVYINFDLENPSKNIQINYSLIKPLTLS